MVSGIQQSLSGLGLNRAQVSSSAHNTANLATDGFPRQQATGSEGRSGGVRTRIDTVELTNNERQIADRLPGAQNNVRLVDETVSRIAAARRFEANSSVIRSQDRLTQSLLDLTG